MSFSSYILHTLSLRQKIVIILLFSSVILGIIGVYITHSEWIFSLICGCLSYILLMIVTFQSISLKIMQKIQEADTEQKLSKYANQYDDETQDTVQRAIVQDSGHTTKTLESLPSCVSVGYTVQDMQNSIQNLDSNDYALVIHPNMKRPSASTKNTKQTAIETSASNLWESKDNKSDAITNNIKPVHEATKCTNKETLQKLDVDLHMQSDVKKHDTSKKSKGKERTKFLDLSKASLGFELSFSLPRIFAFMGIIVCCVALVWFGMFYPLVYLFGVFLGVVLVMCFLLIKQRHNDFIENLNTT